MDSRYPVRYKRDIHHTCSYPDDSFSCAYVSTGSYHVGSEYVGEPMSYPRGTHYAPPGCNPSREGRPPSCCQCGQCNRRWTSDNVNFPAGVDSYAYFCSGNKVDGKWLMQRVFYKDSDCQNYSYLDSVLTIPLPNVPVRNDTMCQALTHRCS